MKTPLLIQSNDWHLKKENIDTIFDLVNQKCDLADELEVNEVIIAGDIFDSRSSQRLEILLAFLDILDIFHKRGIHCYIIPGNHDKTRYDLKESFLNSYKHHPAASLIDDYVEIDLYKDVRFHFMPFFKEDIWQEKFKPDLLDKGNNILITHIAVTGSRNNDGSLVESSLNVGMFTGFDKIFSGHYHDHQVIKNKFVHCPSLYQQNYGEDNKKGFTVIYDDLTYEIRKSKFKEYKKVKVNLDEVNKSELDDLMKEYSNTDDNIRFEVLGSESKVKSIKKENFYALGIDVKTKVKEVEDSLIYAEQEEIVSFNNSSIKEEFKECCEENGWDFEIGNKYLERKLNG